MPAHLVIHASQEKDGVGTTDTVLLYIAQCKRFSLSLRDGPKRKMERRNNARRMELAYDPKPLIQLQKLQAEVERAIEQKLRRLEKTKS